MRRSGEGGRWGRRGEILSDKGQVASSGEGIAGRVSQEEYRRVYMGRLRCSRNLPSLHLPPPQHQPLHYPQKAVTPTPI